MSTESTLGDELEEGEVVDDGGLHNAKVPENLDGSQNLGISAEETADSFSGRANPAELSARILQNGGGSEDESNDGNGGDGSNTEKSEPCESGDDYEICESTEGEFSGEEAILKIRDLIGEDDENVHAFTLKLLSHISHK
ncbi:unnamed protein product [Gongylonema pulchrum]|uniref:Uncharacterized protein n=1 Tax=Gongylonema pulchrum TaxID=637853 RepID=A0A183DIX0_9BILA|nr:unnamed protein product [Gongylonema pulchrum]